MELKDKKVLVYGAGKSGIGAAALLSKVGAHAVVFDEKKSIFNPLTVEDYAAFYADQKVEVESKAKTQGVLSEARTQAKLAVRNLLTPVMAEEWELEIK